MTKTIIRRGTLREEILAALHYWGPMDLEGVAKKLLARSVNPYNMELLNELVDLKELKIIREKQGIYAKN